MPKTKKKGRQDATLVNVRAQKKRELKLEKRMDHAEAAIAFLFEALVEYEMIRRKK